MQKIITFESGLKLIYASNPAVRSVAIGVFVGAGAVHESKEITGISHFIEHMVFKGTTTRSSFDIVNEIDRIGAQINAYTSKSYTCFHTVSLDSNAAKCADVLSDLYFSPTFDPEELKKERSVVIEEINESEDTPDDLCIERLLSAFFKGHPLEKPILGSKKSLEGMDRETLRSYHKKYYMPSNTVISIAGNLSEQEAMALVITYFESRFSIESAFEQQPVLVAPAHSIAVSRKKSIEQTHLALAFPYFPYAHEKTVEAQLMTLIFGMGMSSRLFQSVREKLGLCYTVEGYPSAYAGNGAFVIYLSTTPSNTLRAVDAVRREIDLLLRDGVTAEELQKAKEQLKTSLVLGQESTASMMRTFGTHAIMTGKLYDLSGRVAAIDRVDNDGVMEAARYVFDTRRVCSSIVSPKPEADILEVFRGL